jgi:hypothetical protein
VEQRRLGAWAGGTFVVRGQGSAGCRGECCPLFLWTLDVYTAREGRRDRTGSCGAEGVDALRLERKGGEEGVWEFWMGRAIRRGTLGTGGWTDHAQQKPSAAAA